MPTILSSNAFIWFLIGAVWNTLNLWLLFLIVRTAFSGNKKRGITAIFLFLKFPLLYLLAYFILANWKSSIVGLILGFSLPLVVGVFWAISYLKGSLRPDYANDSPTNKIEHSHIFDNIKEANRS